VGAFTAIANKDKKEAANAESAPAGGDKAWAASILAPVLEPSNSAPAKTTGAAGDSGATLL